MKRKKKKLNNETFICKIMTIFWQLYIFLDRLFLVGYIYAPDHVANLCEMLSLICQLKNKWIGYVISNMVWLNLNVTYDFCMAFFVFIHDIISLVHKQLFCCYDHFCYKYIISSSLSFLSPYVHNHKKGYDGPGNRKLGL